jgi:hypothetical protein
VETVKRARTHRPLDARITQPKGEQLRPARDAMLACRQLGDPGANWSLNSMLYR